MPLMKILGYGEDALTYWALNNRLGAILVAVGDNSNPQDCSIYFRPSFGRRGNPPIPAGAVAKSSQFGEFDAIVGSPVGVYLIETKWRPSSCADGGLLILQPEQVFRHKVFRAYLTAWRSQPHSSWSEFSLALGGLLPIEHSHMPIAPVGSQTARSLERVLTDLGCKGPDTQDILLYLKIRQHPFVALVESPTFRLVTIECPSDYGFVEMAE